VINLLWDPYEGFSFASYKIYRYSVKSGMQTLATISSDQFTYTDTKPSPYALYYVVAAVKPGDPCDPSLLKISEGPYSQSLSNLEDNRLKGDTTIALKENYISSFSVSPNPFGYDAMVNYYLEKTTNVEIKIFNTLGMLVKEQNLGCQIPGDHQSTITSEGLSNGVYILKLSTEGQSEIIKIIVSK
jgi:hypothetical protein